MTPGVFNLKYLSFYLAKYQKKRQFWNSQNLQFSTLTLLFEFGQVGAEILKKKTSKFFCGHSVNMTKIILHSVLFICDSTLATTKGWHPPKNSIFTDIGQKGGRRVDGPSNLKKISIHFINSMGWVGAKVVKKG